MLSLEQIRNELKDRRLNLISEKTGLNYRTLRELRDNPNANPSYRTLKTISEYLES